MMSPSQTDTSDEDLMTDRPHNPTRGRPLKKRVERVKFCPRCGSTNLTFLVYYQPSTWQCLDCGYQGAFIVEDSELAEKIREKSSSKTLKEK